MKDSAESKKSASTIGGECQHYRRDNSVESKERCLVEEEQTCADALGFWSVGCAKLVAWRPLHVSTTVTVAQHCLEVNREGLLMNAVRFVKIFLAIQFVASLQASMRVDIEDRTKSHVPTMREIDMCLDREGQAENLQA